MKATATNMLIYSNYTEQMVIFASIGWVAALIADKHHRRWFF